MAEFKITRFRYTWREAWSGSSVTYYKDDVVFYQGSAYVCIRQHTSSVFNDAQLYTAPGDTFASPGWVKMADGRKWNGAWTAATRYDSGAIVYVGGNLYLCIDSHVSGTNFLENVLDWDILAVGYNFRNTWAPSTRYRVGDVVRYNGYTYQCVLEHDSSTIANGISVGNNDAQDDSTLETWTPVVANYTYIGTWQSNTRYRFNDLVRYGGSILKCTIEHTSALAITSSNFTTYLAGFNYSDEWDDGTYYAVGDVVRKGGILYVATANSQNSEPGISVILQEGNPDWTAISKAVNWTGIYNPTALIAYNEGDLVRRGGSLWVSLTDQINDDSTLMPFDTSNWQPVIPAQNYRGSWNPSATYNLYDIVYWRGVAYSANTPHASSFENFPGDNGSGFNYWDIVVIGDEDAALSQLGDLLTYNLQRNIIYAGGQQYVLGDTSTLGPTNLQVGNEDEVLIVNNSSGDLGYAVWGEQSRAFYVRVDGVDDDTDPNRGTNYFKPYKTVKFALEQADDGYSGYTSVKVSTGTYEEFLPLIVPVRTAVLGDELRGVTIKPNPPIEALAQDAQYTLDTLTRLGLILGDVIQGSLITPTVGNTITQNTSVTSTSSIATDADQIWADIITVIDYLVNDIGSYPTVTGHNVEAVDSATVNAIHCLNNNRNFLKEEAIQFMVVNHPNYSFDTVKCRRDIDRYIDSLIYDLRFPGNYKSVLAGRYYANAVTGSAHEDMFYVRDTTGVRNMTLRGLTGTLPALQEGESYSIPTGGAFVSLDPGWGPDDEKVWITSRSCYVQNVTTFGTAAIGQKIDGALHNGGNRSIVSNDFTQVVSDGIGAWVANGGRAELVSVFTYYAHIGMFAQDGGVIRATNGNSSYGDFGTVADGIDPNEVVKYGYLNTRTEQAQVESAFAGEILDYILALEFSNAGQNYTTASYSIESSGTGAVAVQEEIRDNAMFEVQLLDAGAGFTQYGNQAQIGNELTITLATSETVEEAEILGMRIIIISGEGTGQYGYVQAYSDLTKVCTVYRESDGQPGWDHILPGTPASALLTTGSRYRIEPRITFNEPPYSATEVTLGSSNSWAAAVYGETSETFTAVTGTLGTGPVIDVIPAAAEFTVIKTGRSYSVVISNGGAGYAADDTIIIDGGDVGGISGEHDILITVLTTSEDSTNSILTFEIADNSLIADSGKFILTPSSGHFGRYSSDGDTWTSFDLPVDGNWKCLAAGNNRFVAVSSGSNNAASSTNGIDWTARTMPNSRNWNGVVYGKPSTAATGIFVAVSGNLNSAAYSINGTTWFGATMPTFGDSTLNEYVDIAFGYDKFVALANSGNLAAVGTWNGTSLTWQGIIMDVVADSSSKDWTSIAYGNRRFVAVSSTGDIGYSFDGIDWYAGGQMPSQDGSTAHFWKQIRYGQGVFFAVGDTGMRVVGDDATSGINTFAASSYDGIVWTSRTLVSELDWGVVAFGNPDVTIGDSTLSNNLPVWITAPTTSSNKLNYIQIGARALGRAVVEGTGLSLIKIWEPGSNYTSDPTFTVIDPSKTEEPVYRTRLADGVLAQPTFTSRGTAYKTSTTYVTVQGDGFADITPNGRFITIDGLTLMPGPGAQFYIGGREDYFNAVIVGINETVDENGGIRSTFQVSPRPDLADNLEHGMEIVIRELYSQVRITGHDFLDVGTGNFEETNYPDLYIDYEFSTQPFQEVNNLNGGRVFYTSTDQDGNFRAGEQFAVEQATGVITISADFFDLEGLTELRLAGINVGSTAIIREFSKDPLFLQNSNNVIPTQRAIRGYLQSRLNIGGEDLLTPSFIAGTVRVGPNLINSTAALTVLIPIMANFEGNGVGISGSMLAQTMFFRSFGQD